MQYGEIYSTDSDSFRWRTAHVPFRASACAGDHESILFPLFRTSLTSVTAETEAMDASKDEAAADFCPRSYQLELFNCALKKNSILVLGTGSGKTFISILLIKELGHQIRESLKGGSKRTVFVVNTVPLA
ncbi:endoribonuclease Dicer homolog 3a-like [Penaeus monodon]|uniref:endoribonuclease Dicer homolog 3a-like n=1 Tax=Penaeus monodon TaxID=6687 RepID=UPI0018A7084E|nr:endoribonuclease Dicer homolog 3a-like [Penaeus monodon]